MSANRKATKQAAFEIKKGPRHVMTLSERDVEKYLDLRELLDGLEDGFRGLELGEVQSAPRLQLSVAGKGFSLAMPPWRRGMQMTVKVVNVFDGNVNFDLPNHLALINATAWHGTVWKGLMRCPRILRLAAEEVGNLSALSGVAYDKWEAILTSLAAPRPAPKPRAPVEEVPAARCVHVFKLKICPSSARLLYGPVPVALPATVDDVHCHG